MRIFIKYNKNELSEKLKYYTKYTLIFVIIRFNRHTLCQIAFKVSISISEQSQLLNLFYMNISKQSQQSELLNLSCGPGTVHGAALPTDHTCQDQVVTVGHKMKVHIVHLFIIPEYLPQCFPLCISKLHIL